MWGQTFVEPIWQKNVIFLTSEGQCLLFCDVQREICLGIELKRKHTLQGQLEMARSFHQHPRLQGFAAKSFSEDEFCNRLKPKTSERSEKKGNLYADWKNFFVKNGCCLGNLVFFQKLCRFVGLEWFEIGFFDVVFSCCYLVSKTCFFVGSVQLSLRKEFGNHVAISLDHFMNKIVGIFDNPLRKYNTSLNWCNFNTSCEAFSFCSESLSIFFIN